MNKNLILDKLQAQHQSQTGKTLQETFRKDSNRAENFSLTAEGIFFDYSKNLISEESLKTLADLSASLDLASAIENMFTGAKINVTENRAVLHTALRDHSKQPIYADQQNVKPQIKAAYQRAAEFSKKVQNKKWLGVTGEPITTIVNLGIGGSDLGPRMACQALARFRSAEVTVKFVSNVDPAEIEAICKQLNPHKTLFIIASKTFTTLETMANARYARRWLEAKLGTTDLTPHFVGLSANFALAKEFGIAGELIFPLWDWVGGRFSLASSIGLSLMLLIGPAQFEELLSGMHSIDKHFRQQPFLQNIPWLMAAIGFWHSNFWRFATHALIPYSSELGLFPAYLQQLEMESNGKSVNRHGEKISTPTVPVIWGAAGSDSQHSFFQFLHQGTQIVPCDFIGFCAPNSQALSQHDLLMANFIAQQQALAFGSSAVKTPAAANPNAQAYQQFTGNRPSSCLLFKRLSPFTVGQLIALYEHKTFVQGVLWELYSFDQWGVELGKRLAKEILTSFDQPATGSENDGSTAQIIKQYLLNRLV